MNPESSYPEPQVSVNGNNQQIDQRIFDLYDEYCHGEMDRREFLRRASVITVAGVSALSMAQALLPRYAEAAIVSFNDDRIKARYVEYPSPGGNSGEMRGYLVQPAGEGPWPAVLVVHENRGLNPYVEDVARRCALEGFIALAPDGLYPAGGYPGNDDEGRTLQRGLDQAKLKQDMLNSAQYLKNLDQSTGALGATGFCWGGGVVNFLAVNMGENIRAVVPYYGASVPAEDVSSISAAVMVQSAEQDPRINALWPDFEAALKANDVEYQRFLYPDTQHGFHNNSTPRYNEAAAELSWQRTLAFFQEQLTS
ncbi:MAG: dienelactone hydrolase family protein [Halioglobus sp.]